MHGKFFLFSSSSSSSISLFYTIGNPTDVQLMVHAFQYAPLIAKAQAIPKVIKQYLLQCVRVCAIILHGMLFHSNRLKKITKNRTVFGIHQRALLDMKKRESSGRRC